ncbi:hypothetical protein ABT072_48635, partial [Streptomyces sp. NPDC002589]|uniref:hypothetical protein n=1 Tax=Streptomyces sp. NPDC002589 TaxID=3154420 RepID=UPI003331CF72
MAVLALIAAVVLGAVAVTGRLALRRVPVELGPLSARQLGDGQQVSELLVRLRPWQGVVPCRGAPRLC